MGGAHGHSKKNRLLCRNSLGRFTSGEIAGIEKTRELNDTQKERGNVWVMGTGITPAKDHTTGHACLE